MEPYGVEKPGEFYIIGIAVRTSNKDGRAQKDIGSLWARFMSDGIMERIPGRESADIYCVYTDYESDFNGEYTTVLGCRVSPGEMIPEGMSGKIIPASRYHVYSSSGEMPKALMETWNLIWRSDIERLYTADFDLYGWDAVVKTYISVK
jgi:predicted transcriptional regulator YdeE